MADAVQKFIVGADGKGEMVDLTADEIAQRTVDDAAWAVVMLAQLHQGVKNEAQRRIIVLTGATDLSSCMIKQLNALMRATELTNKKASGQTLTDAETAEAAALTALASAIQALRSASDTIEAMTPIPADFANDQHWSF